MAFFSVACGKHGRLFSLELLLLAASHYFILFANGQQVGVSLKLRGVTIPSDSLVDFDDILYTACCNQDPTNANGLHDQTLVCVTDLVDCCDTPRTVRGDWYDPNGDVVTNTVSPGFWSNRGPNEEINGHQFNGSVRIFRRYTPLQRGRFRCELPSAADPNVTQMLYANIVNFGHDFIVPPVTISPSGSTGTAGETYSLTCSTTLSSDSTPFPSDVPPPTFEWYFGPDNSSLPSGVTSPETTFDNVDTYTSTLQFSPLSQSHAGMYTCRLGPGRLANSAMVIVNAPAISVQITTSGAPMLGQNDYSLTCNVTGAGNLNPTITYQWTKNNITQTQMPPAGADPKVLSFSPLRLSDAGQYTCHATVYVSSPYLNENTTMTDSQDVTIQIPVPTSVVLSSSIPNPIPPFGSDVTLICTVMVTSGPEIDIPLNVNFELLKTDPAESPLTTTPPSVSGSVHTTTAMIISFEREQSGVYTCRASVSSASNNTFINDSNTESHSMRVTTGVYLALRGVFIANNSQINIRNIGQSFDSPIGALQCITDRSPCCATPPNRHGEWYLPNGALIQGTISTTAFYRNRGDNGEVSLNRPSDVVSPTGLFYCEVPDATDTNQILCVNIGGITITSSGSPTAGENYTLECFAGGSEGTFQWLVGPPDGRTPVASSGSITITSTSTTSQLQFKPIQQSDNSTYSCNVSFDGVALSSEPVDFGLSVNAPFVSVQITDGGAAPTAGENYHLTCSVSGAENLNPTIIYQWTKNSDGVMQVVTNLNTLSFTPLRLLDAASYVCTVNISSSYLAGDIVIMDSHDVRIRIPTQSSITLTSSKGNSGIQIVGSDLTLTCTVELNSAIVNSEIFLLVVDAQLSRDGTPLALTGPTVTGTTVTYATQLNSFGRSDSGNYTCTATVRPQPSSTYLTGNEILSDTISIKAASDPPLNVRATQCSSIAPVEVSWSPGATNVTGYRIFYGNGHIQNVLVPSVTVITSVSLKVDGHFLGQNLSIRSESDQLYSELINVAVTLDNNELCAGTTNMTMDSCSCSSEVGIAVGAAIVVMCLVVMVITVTVIVVLCLRKKSSQKKDNFAVSANMAYGKVILEPGEISGGEYEDPDKMILESGQSTDTTITATYETVYTSNPAAPEYASTDEVVCATNK